MKRKLWLVYLPIIFFSVLTRVSADGDAHGTDGHGSMAEGDAPQHKEAPIGATLEAEVARLREIVESLQAMQPTVSSLMPNMAERFHVMHRAGEAEDWAIAAHELEGIKHVVKVIKVADPVKGAMVEGFMTPSFDELLEAIEHKDSKAFNQQLTQAVNSCNACHVAVGSPAMKIVLDARDSVSIRHPHAFGRSTMSMEHMHE